MQERKLLKPKIDVVFHSLFREGNEKLTKSIITAVTNKKIENINLNNDRYILGKYPEEKLGILDLRATLDNGVICNVEIQLADKKDTEERFLYYWSRIYSGQLIKGDAYKDVKKVIGIIIIDYNFEKTKEIKKISTKWKITEVSTGQKLELTDVFELYIIEIKKAREVLKKEPENKLAKWMLFLNDPNEEGVKEMANKDEDIKKAMNELREMSEDEELRRVAELREKAIRDENNALRHAREDGIKEGMQEGIQKGMKAGMEAGIERKKNEIIKKMLLLNMDIETIIKITEAPKEEVEKIEQE